MTRDEAITVLKAFMENPLFSDVHKAAFNIAIHDVKQRHDWDINNLILINKDDYEPLEKEPTPDDCETCIHNKGVLECDMYGCKYEPTTKENLVVDAVSRQAINGYIDYILSHGMGKKKSFDFFKKFVANLPSVTLQLSSGLDKNSKKLEKDFGESDCISRQATVKRLCVLAEFLNEHKENSGVPYIMAALFIQDNKTEFPAVTPQEPKTGHWDDIPKYKDIAWQCSECGHFTTMKHNFCADCGCRMVEPQESEESDADSN